MEIKQFEDKNLAHFSYALYSDGEIALVDPARDPAPYYEYARQKGGKITAVFETHPHADFVSSHLEIHKRTGATIFVSKLLGAGYPHETFDEGDKVLIGGSYLRTLNTPGHSPDSISIVAADESGKDKAVFTGDTLFIGDCGRPDLREKAGAIHAKREELARQMYHSLRKKLMTLADDVLVYPAHGAGSLCGKGLSEQNTSTVGAEKTSNWSLQKMTEDEFVKELLADQPFIPKYFPFDVGINKEGAPNFEESIARVRIAERPQNLDEELIIVDARPQDEFKKSHLKNAINLMEGGKFETWLGSIVRPDEKFYLIANDANSLKQLIARAASIGYEGQIAGAFTNGEGPMQIEAFDSNELKSRAEAYTIIDVRNEAEVKDSKPFGNSINIPLHELRERTNEIPRNKPVVVHCAAGYRSAAGTSILENELNGIAPVYDLGEEIKNFQK